MYKCCFWRVLREIARTPDNIRTILSTANGTVRPEVAPPSVFHEHNSLSVVCMLGRTRTKCTMLKDRDYDVAPYIILILSLIFAPNAPGVDEGVGGEYCRRRVGGEDGRRRVGETLVVVSSVTWSVQW